MFSKTSQTELNATYISSLLWSGIRFKNTSRLFDMMLRHHDTSLRPLTLTLRLTYTTSYLDDITFRQHDLSLRRDDITFRQHRLLLRRDDITFRQHRLLLCRDDITFRLHYRTFR